MSDLIQRLKLCTDFDQCRKAMLEAANEIERLNAIVRVQTLEEAWERASIVAERINKKYGGF
jgi:hypothetical protein